MCGYTSVSTDLTLLPDCIISGSQGTTPFTTGIPNKLGELDGLGFVSAVGFYNHLIASPLM